MKTTLGIQRSLCSPATANVNFSRLIAKGWKLDEPTLVKVQSKLRLFTVIKRTLVIAFVALAATDALPFKTIRSHIAMLQLLLHWRFDGFLCSHYPFASALRAEPLRITLILWSFLTLCRSPLFPGSKATTIEETFVVGDKGHDNVDETLAKDFVLASVFMNLRTHELLISY